tara:strand:- start:1884 stop:2849 length:966 start_codon:yes stop_codon:yes gene_type:complete
VKEFEKIIKEDINLFDKKFKNILSSKATLLYKVNSYLIKQRGKRIRPICTIIASGLANNITSQTFRAAVLIELLHTATLIHDDIVDDAHIRRSTFSINTIWKNKVAVLSGDYFLAKGLSLAVENKDYEILMFISNVVEKIVEGELLQIEKTKKLNLTEDEYFKIIKLKTASLFECAFQVGAMSNKKANPNLEQIINLGLMIGNIFQIKDDILDYRPTRFIGKNTGSDVKEGKINLPLLYALKTMPVNQKKQVFKVLRKKTNTLKEIISIQNIVINNYGIVEAENKMMSYYNNSMKILSRFEETKYKNAAKLMLKFLISRNK